MISQNGYIKLNRKLNKWGWKTDPNMVALWVHLLTNASYEQHEFLGIKIEPGQLVTGRKKLAFETGISERTIRTCLKYLKATNEVTIKTTSKYSIISIVKWQEYQASDQVTDQQVTSKRPTSDQQVTTTQEGKEIKKVKNSIRGTKLLEDWQLDSDGRKYAFEARWTEQEINNEVLNFRDYYINGSGRTKTMKSWPQAWQTWVRKNYNKNGSSAGNGSVNRAGNSPELQEKLDAIFRGD